MIFFSYSSAQSLKKQYVQIWFLLASIVVDDIKLIYNAFSPSSHPRI